MQTVQTTTSGIDPQTGFTVDAVMAGRIVSQLEVEAVEKRLAGQTQTAENL